MIAAPITRRNLVRTAGAALGAAAIPGAVGATAAAAAPATAAPGAASDDAELLSLIERHGPAQATCRALVREGNRIASEYLAAMPKRPNALGWHPNDHLGVGTEREVTASDRLRLWYGEAQVDQLRRLPPYRRTTWTAEGPSQKGGPDHDREARRQAIIAAHDAWEVECQALSDRLGMEQADINADAAADALDELERQIVGTPARTIAGLAAKAAWLITADRIGEDGEAIIREMAAFAQAGA